MDLFPGAVYLICRAVAGREQVIVGPCDRSCTRRPYLLCGISESGRNYGRAVSRPSLSVLAETQAGAEADILLARRSSVTGRPVSLAK
jgi:hypothetical protein